MLLHVRRFWGGGGQQPWQTTHDIKERVRSTTCLQQLGQRTEPKQGVREASKRAGLARHAPFVSLEDDVPDAVRSEAAPTVNATLGKRGQRLREHHAALSAVHKSLQYEAGVSPEQGRGVAEAEAARQQGHEALQHVPVLVMGIQGTRRWFKRVEWRCAQHIVMCYGRSTHTGWC